MAKATSLELGRRKGLVGQFNEAYKLGYGLEHYENAFKSYLLLDLDSRAILRSYTSRNEKLDFRKLVEGTFRLLPNGTADVVGRRLLLEDLTEEIKTFPESEKRRYLRILKKTFKN